MLRFALLVLLLATGDIVQATADVLPVNVDINGSHIVIRGSEPRDWNNMTVVLNGWWEFTVKIAPRQKALCINAGAFTVKQSVRRDGADYEGIRFDPATMKIKTVGVTIGGNAVRLNSVTSGMIKPLTPDEVLLMCVGSVK